jgi:phosphopantothenoylcysteine decarboxylase/phosphopantothenate--cysteine ligase
MRPRRDYDRAVNILVSAGPTREWIDDVRFLSNESSGVMGYAVATAARDRGHRVVLVSGPTSLPRPAGVEFIAVESAVEMRGACLAAFRAADAAVMVAAVADYRPADRAPGKIKKESDELVLRLVKNPDILAELGMMRGRRTLVGFALEAAPLETALAHARGKLERKGADLIVLNRPASFGGPAAHDVVLVSEREAVPLGIISKSRLAERLVEFVENASSATPGSVDGSPAESSVRDDPGRGPS